MTTTVAEAPQEQAGPRHARRLPAGPGASSVRRRLAAPMPDDGWWGWLGPLAVTLVGGILRFVNLGHPHAFSFDETYYAKDGLALWRFGFEQQTISNANDLILKGDTNVFTGQGSFIVHPPIGKWLIGFSEWVFGVTPFGWRFATAALGTLAVLLVARIGRRLTRSTLLGTIAGLLLALDGLSIVLSRTAILDGIVAFFVLASFGALLVDRDRMRSRLAGWAEARPDEPLPDGVRGPRMGLRPWRLAMGLLLGLACATKWNGVFYLAGFGILTVLWDAGARRAVGIRRPLLAMLRRDAVPAFVSTVPVAIAVYVVSWTGWFATSGGWDRTWADGRTTSFGSIPAPLRSWWHYHAEMLHFNTGLTTPHNYAAKPIGWPLMIRPTAFWTDNVQQGQHGCTSTSCVSEVIALGTPLLWWGATLALVWTLWRWAAARDWRAGAVLMGVAAGWLPWVVLYSSRTVFTSYSVVFAPFLALAVTLALGAILGPARSSPRRTWGAAAVGSYLLLVLANTAWIWPLLVGDQLPYAQWLRRLWFRGWI